MAYEYFPVVTRDLSNPVEELAAIANTWGRKGCRLVGFGQKPFSNCNLVGIIEHEMVNAKPILHHNDNGCTESLDEHGMCVSCFFPPDKESTRIWYHCPVCNKLLIEPELKCEKCGISFSKP